MCGVRSVFEGVYTQPPELSPRELGWPMTPITIHYIHFHQRSLLFFCDVARPNTLSARLLGSQGRQAEFYEGVLMVAPRFFFARDKGYEGVTFTCNVSSSTRPLGRVPTLFLCNLKFSSLFGFVISTDMVLFLGALHSK